MFMISKGISKSTMKVSTYFHMSAFILQTQKKKVPLAFCRKSFVFVHCCTKTWKRRDNLFASSFYTVTYNVSRLDWKDMYIEKLGWHFSVLEKTQINQCLMVCATPVAVMGFVTVKSRGQIFHVTWSESRSVCVVLTNQGRVFKFCRSSHVPRFL